MASKRRRDELDEDTQMNISPTSPEHDEAAAKRPRLFGSESGPSLTSSNCIISAPSISDFKFLVPSAPSQLDNSERMFLTCQTALQQLSHTLDIDVCLLNEASKILKLRLESLATPLTSDTQFYMSSMAIWIAKRFMSKTSPFTISRLVRALGKHVSRASSSTFLSGPDVILFLEELEKFGPCLAPNVSESDLQVFYSTVQRTKSLHSHNTLLFHVFDSVLRVFLPPDDGSLAAARSSQVRRFAWILFYYIREQIFHTSYDIDAEKAVCLITIFFVLSQVPLHYLLPKNVICQALNVDCEEMHPSVQHHWYSAVHPITDSLCSKFQISSNAVQMMQTTVIHTLQTCKLNGCLKSNSIEDVVLPNQPFQWKWYVGAFDIENGGLLLSNSQVASYLLSTIVYHRGYEIDPVSLVTSAENIVSATPARFNRTPRTSILKTSARNLMSAFSKTSSLNHSMPETPLTAKVFVGKQNIVPGMQSGLVDQIQEHTKLASRQFEVLFSNSLYSSTLPNIKGRAEKLLEFLKTRASADPKLLLLVYQVYAHLLNQIAQQSKNREPEAQTALFNDSQFHRCLLGFAMELIRFASNMNQIQFNDIVSAVDLHFADFIWAVDLCLYYEPWIPDSMIKRFKTLEERILEGEIWNAPEFRSCLVMLTNESSHNIQVHCSQTCLLYKDLVPDHIVEMGLNDNFITACISNRPKLMKPFESLFRKILHLIHSRISRFCKDLQFASDVETKIREIVLTLILQEPTLQLILNRNIDIIIIATIYACTRLDETPKKLTEIIKVYKKQPQYLETTCTQIFMGQDVPKADLIKFYNKIFLAPVRKLLFPPSAVSQPTSPQTVEPEAKSSHYSSSFSSLCRQAALNASQSSSIDVFATPHRLPLMTPVTRKLYSHGETPLRSPTAIAGSNMSTKRRLDLNSTRPPRLPH